MLDITIRSTEAQGTAAVYLLTELHPGAVLHSATHNLDGLWLNLRYTAGDGDWIASIDRDGNIERTQ